jgi:thioredoxin 1
MSNIKNQLSTATIGLAILMLISCSSGNAQFKKAETQTAGVVIHINDSLFKQKIFNYSAKTQWEYAGDIPCIIDFYADWCAPCRQMSPLLEEIAKKYEGKLVVYKVDTDKERLLTQNMGISSLPTIVFCPKSGKPKGSVGAVSMEDLEKQINSVLLTQKN